VWRGIICGEAAANYRELRQTVTDRDGGGEVIVNIPRRLALLVLFLWAMFISYWQGHNQGWKAGTLRQSELDHEIHRIVDKAVEDGVRPVWCLFDSASNKDAYVEPSTTTAGDCHERGDSTNPIIGVVESTN
jgi:hypothetical protein